MKHLIFIAFFSIGAFAGTPEEMKVPVNHVYAPAGFDTNDNVEIVVTGLLPNLCHKSPSAKVSLKDSTIEIEVTSLFYGNNNPFCPEMAVPFSESVSLGLLDEGEYTVIVKNKEKQVSAKLTVSGAISSTVDTHNYAYVEYVEKKEGSDTVTLRGYHLSDCFMLDRIDYIHNKKDTYSILPILKQVSRFCPRKLTPFSYEFVVPGDLEAQRVLLHVRTLNGNAVNTIFVR